MTTLPQTTCTCLYCGTITGRTPLQTCGSDKWTICQSCAWSIDRSESREIAAGMTPWLKSMGGSR